MCKNCGNCKCAVKRGKSLEELQYEVLGDVGTPTRDEFEKEIKEKLDEDAEK